MAKPLPKPKYLTQYALLTIIGNKFQFMQNSLDLQSTGLWSTRQLAEQQVLIEKLKVPGQRYEIYEIEWPTGYSEESNEV
jgi:hypothetical protein